MHATLIVPAPFDTVSGGYAYDRRIVAGLRGEGHTMEIRELTGGDAALAVVSLPAETIPVIDGLALPRVRRVCGHPETARGCRADPPSDGTRNRP